MANKNRIDETEVFHISLEDGNEILLDNKEGIWQAKLLADGEVLVILNLLSLDNAKRAIDYLRILQMGEKYMTDTDVMISETSQNEIKDFLLSLVD